MIALAVDSIITRGEPVVELPTVSVVVRAYRRPQTLTRTLKSVAHLDYADDRIEVLVVGTQGDPSAKEALEALLPEVKAGFRISTVMIDQNSASAAWNAGIKQSQGDYVLVLTDDVLLHPLTLKKALNHFAEDRRVAVVTFPVVPEGLASVMDADITFKLHHLRYYGTVSAANTILAFGLYDREVLLRAGLFREDMGPPFSLHEDWELGSRISKKGHRVVAEGRLLQTHCQVRVEGEAKTPGTSEGLKPSRAIRMMSAYVRAFTRKNWWSMLQVLRASPLAQLAEYASYLAFPIILLVLLLVNWAYAVIVALAVCSSFIFVEIARGYFSVFPWRYRAAYSTLLLLVRVFRTCLLAVSLVVNLRRLREGDERRGFDRQNRTAPLLLGVLP